MKEFYTAKQLFILYQKEKAKWTGRPYKIPKNWKKIQTRNDWEMFTKLANKLNKEEINAENFFYVNFKHRKRFFPRMFMSKNTWKLYYTVTKNTKKLFEMFLEDAKKDIEKYERIYKIDFPTIFEHKLITHEIEKNKKFTLYLALFYDRINWETWTNEDYLIYFKKNKKEVELEIQKLYNKFKNYDSYIKFINEWIKRWKMRKKIY